jgi:tetratricopeptide (TPR) repeat protein
MAFAASRGDTRRGWTKWVALSRAQALPFYEHIMVPGNRAWVALEADDAALAESLYRSGTAVWSESGERIALPDFRTRHAQALGRFGMIAEASALVCQALEQIARPGWEERYHLAETLRTKAWLAERSGNSNDAEELYLQALELARSQGAKWWELRAARDCARVMHAQGRFRAARELLGPVYDWFREGLDLPDLQEARALLRALE